MLFVPNAFGAEPIATNNNEFLKIAENPDRYKGVLVVLSGEVSGIQQFEDVQGLVFKVGGIDNRNRDTAWIQTDYNSRFSEDKCYFVEGYIEGGNTLTRGITGQEYEAPWFWLKNYQETDCLTALYPATASASMLPITKTAGGVKVTLEKAEISNDHLRLFFSLENKRYDAEVSAYSFNTLVIQDKKQFTNAYVFADYDEWESTIPSGVIETGWMIKEPIEAKPFEIRMEIKERADDWRDNQEHNIVFRINNVQTVHSTLPPPTTSQQTQQTQQQTQQTQQQTQQTQQQTQQQSKGGGCLIATAAFGSEMAPQVQFLRELRDNTVLQTESGTSFMTGFNQFYYSFSPAVADYERENPAFKEAVKLTLTPLLTSLTLLQYADIDSESEMLGYGIGIILLNIGMYFVAPAVLIMKVRKLRFP